MHQTRSLAKGNKKSRGPKNARALTQKRKFSHIAASHPLLQHNNLHNTPHISVISVFPQPTPTNSITSRNSKKVKIKTRQKTTQTKKQSPLSTKLDEFLLKCSQLTTAMISHQTTRLTSTLGLTKAPFPLVTPPSTLPPSASSSSSSHPIQSPLDLFLRSPLNNPLEQNEEAILTRPVNLPILTPTSKHSLTRSLLRAQRQAFRRTQPQLWDRPFNWSATIPPEQPVPITKQRSLREKVLTVEKLYDQYGALGNKMYFGVSAFSMGLVYMIFAVSPTFDPITMLQWLGEFHAVQLTLGKQTINSLINHPIMIKFMMTYIVCRFLNPVRLVIAATMANYFREKEMFTNVQIANILDSEGDEIKKYERIQQLLHYTRHEYGKHDQFQSLSLRELFDITDIQPIPDLNAFDSVDPTLDLSKPVERNPIDYIGPKATTNQMIRFFNRTGLPIGTLAKEGTKPIVKEYFDLDDPTRVEYIVVRLTRIDGAEIESIRSTSRNRTSVHIWTPPDEKTGERYQRTDMRFGVGSKLYLREKAKREYIRRHGKWALMGFTAEHGDVYPEFRAAYEDFWQPMVLPQTYYDQDDVEWYRFHRHPALNYGGNEESVNPVGFAAKKTLLEQQRKLEDAKKTLHPFHQLMLQDTLNIANEINDLAGKITTLEQLEKQEKLDFVKYPDTGRPRKRGEKTAEEIVDSLVPVDPRTGTRSGYIFRDDPIKKSEAEDTYQWIENFHKKHKKELEANPLIIAPDGSRLPIQPTSDERTLDNILGIDTLPRESRRFLQYTSHYFQTKNTLDDNDPNNSSITQQLNFLEFALDQQNTLLESERQLQREQFELNSPNSQNIVKGGPSLLSKHLTNLKAKPQWSAFDRPPIIINEHSTTSSPNNNPTNISLSKNTPDTFHVSHSTTNPHLSTQPAQPNPEPNQPQFGQQQLYQVYKQPQTASFDDDTSTPQTPSATTPKSSPYKNTYEVELEELPQLSYPTPPKGYSTITKPKKRTQPVSTPLDSPHDASKTHAQSFTADHHDDAAADDDDEAELARLRQEHEEKEYELYADNVLNAVFQDKLASAAFDLDHITASTPANFRERAREQLEVFKIQFEYEVQNMPKDSNQSHGKTPTFTEFLRNLGRRRIQQRIYEETRREEALVLEQYNGNISVEDAQKIKKSEMKTKKQILEQKSNILGRFLDQVIYEYPPGTELIDDFTVLITPTVPQPEPFQFKGSVFGDKKSTKASKKDTKPSTLSSYGIDDAPLDRELWEEIQARYIRKEQEAKLKIAQMTIARFKQDAGNLSDGDDDGDDGDGDDDDISRPPADYTTDGLKLKNAKMERRLERLSKKRNVPLHAEYVKTIDQIYQLRQNKQTNNANDGNASIQNGAGNDQNNDFAYLDQDLLTIRDQISHQTKMPSGRFSAIPNHDPIQHYYHPVETKMNILQQDSILAKSRQNRQQFNEILNKFVENTFPEHQTASQSAHQPNSMSNINNSLNNALETNIQTFYQNLGSQFGPLPTTTPAPTSTPTPPIPPSRPIVAETYESELSKHTSLSPDRLHPFQAQYFDTLVDPEKKETVDDKIVQLLTSKAGEYVPDPRNPAHPVYVPAHVFKRIQHYREQLQRVVQKEYAQYVDDAQKNYDYDTYVANRAIRRSQGEQVTESEGRDEMGKRIEKKIPLTFAEAEKLSQGQGIEHGLQELAKQKAAHGLNAEMDDIHRMRVDAVMAAAAYDPTTPYTSLEVLQNVQIAPPKLQTPQERRKRYKDALKQPWVQQFANLDGLEDMLDKAYEDDKLAELKKIDESKLRIDVPGIDDTPDGELLTEDERMKKILEEYQRIATEANMHKAAGNSESEIYFKVISKFPKAAYIFSESAYFSKQGSSGQYAGSIRLTDRGDVNAPGDPALPPRSQETDTHNFIKTQWVEDLFEYDTIRLQNEWLEKHFQSFVGLSMDAQEKKSVELQALLEEGYNYKDELDQDHLRELYHDPKTEHMVHWDEKNQRYVPDPKFRTPEHKLREREIKQFFGDGSVDGKDLKLDRGVIGKVDHAITQAAHKIQAAKKQFDSIKGYDFDKDVQNSKNIGDSLLNLQLLKRHETFHDVPFEYGSWRDDRDIKATPATLIDFHAQANRHRPLNNDELSLQRDQERLKQLGEKFLLTNPDFNNQTREETKKYIDNINEQNLKKQQRLDELYKRTGNPLGIEGWGHKDGDPKKPYQNGLDFQKDQRLPSHQDDFDRIGKIEDYNNNETPYKNPRDSLDYEIISPDGRVRGRDFDVAPKFDSNHPSWGKDKVKRPPYGPDFPWRWDITNNEDLMTDDEWLDHEVDSPNYIHGESGIPLRRPKRVPPEAWLAMDRKQRKFQIYTAIRDKYNPRPRPSYPGRPWSSVTPVEYFLEEKPRLIEPVFPDREPEVDDEEPAFVTQTDEEALTMAKSLWGKRVWEWWMQTDLPYPKLSLMEDPFQRRLKINPDLPYDNHFFERQEAERPFWTLDPAQLPKPNVPINRIHEYDHPEMQRFAWRMRKIGEIQQLIIRQSLKVFFKNRYIQKSKNMKSFHRSLRRDLVEYNLKMRIYQRDMKEWERGQHLAKIREQVKTNIGGMDQADIDDVLYTSDIIPILPKFDKNGPQAFDQIYKYP